MTKLIIKTLPLLLVSGLAIAEYKIYSAPQDNGGEVLNVPEPSCVDASTVEDGFHVVCGAGSDEVPVAGGEAFNVKSVIPLEGFSCSNGYATHDQAIALATLLSVRIYTPYYSFLPLEGLSGSAKGSRGRMSYVLSNGVSNNDYSYAYSDYKIYDGYNYYDSFDYGSKDSLDPQYASGSYRDPTYGIDDSTTVLTKVANRACVIGAGN